MIMSSRLLSVVIACRSRSVKLSRIIRVVMFVFFYCVKKGIKSRLSVRRRSPSAFGTKWITVRGCAEKSWKYSRSRMRLLKSFKSALTSVQFMKRGVGKKR